MKVRGVMRNKTRIEIVGALVATTATAIAAVWLTSDPRAFGAVIAFAGLVVGIALGRQEWQTAHPRRNADARHTPDVADIGKAA